MQCMVTMICQQRRSFLIYVQGAALQIIDGFETTAANYKPAIDTIEHRFGRKKIIVSHLVNLIVKFEMKDRTKAVSLPQLHDTPQNRISAVEGRGVRSTGKVRGSWA